MTRDLQIAAWCHLFMTHDLQIAAPRLQIEVFGERTGRGRPWLRRA
jgi:hypothetical protein